MLEEGKEPVEEDSTKKRKRTRIYSMSIYDENGQKSSQKQFTKVIEVMKKKQVESQRENPVESRQPAELEKEDAGSTGRNSNV